MFKLLIISVLIMLTYRACSAPDKKVSGAEHFYTLCIL